MERTYFSSENFHFWLKVLTEYCLKEKLPCRPFSNEFATEAFAKIEGAKQDRKIQEEFKKAKLPIGKSLSGEPMVRAEHYFEVFCTQQE